MKHFIFSIVFAYCSWCSATAAQSFIPLDAPIHIKLTAQDTGMLTAYNLYEFDYVSGADTFLSAFIILKSEDTISHKRQLDVVLTRVKEYMVISPADGRKAFMMPVEDGIEVSKGTDPGKKSYLNFDPLQPETVFLLKSIIPGKDK